MRIVRGAGCLVVVVSLAMGCDDGGGTGMSGDGGRLDGAAMSDTGGGTGDTGSSACSTTTTMGSLTVTVTGLPAGVAAAVTVTGAGSPMTVTATQTLMVAGGSYTVTARRVAGPADPIARQAWEPAVSGAGAGICVREGMTATVTVNHTLIASSNKLWLSNANGTAAMLGYAPSALAATGMPMANVAAMTESAAGFTFDAAGNLWALGSTTADAPIARYPAASLGAGGSKTPDIEIGSPSFGGGSPGPKALAFDRMGNLWSVVVSADKVVRFTPAQIAASGMPTASVEITGLEGPLGLAFDMAGNLWVSAGDRVVRIDAARLGASAAGGDLTIELQRPAPTTGMVRAGRGLAFDKDGNLWVEAGILCRLTPADLAGTGMKTVTPAVQIELPVTALPEGLAFDESSALWVASAGGKFTRFTSDKLAASGAPDASVVITSTDVGSADFFGIYPAPAALPLYHRLP
jgi:sugar lactone lactonase YvrE